MAVSHLSALVSADVELRTSSKRPILAVSVPVWMPAFFERIDKSLDAKLGWFERVTRLHQTRLVTLNFIVQLHVFQVLVCALVQDFVSQCMVLSSVM